MGIYTSFLYRSYSDVNYDYTQVEPFVGEHFNYHALGIQVTTESMKNHNEFMKAIALGELASYEQYGTEEMFYEAINFGSIIDRVKAFFKKIIEKIHKIFHTFIAKMSSWFGGNRDFCRKYEKEIIKNWANVKNDWEFKGYNFENINSLMNKNTSEYIKTAIKSLKDIAFKPMAALLNASADPATFEAILKLMTKTHVEGDDNRKFVLKNNNSAICIKITASIKNQLTSNGVDPTGKDFIDTIVMDGKNLKPVTDTSYVSSHLYTKSEIEIAGKNDSKIVTQEIPTGDDIGRWRDDFNEKGKDNIRYQILENIKDAKVIIPAEIDISFGSTGSLDQKEFTEELFKYFRKDEDSPTDLNKHDIETCYGSITAMITFIKDYDKIKSNLEKAEKNMVKGIDDLIKALNKAEDNMLKYDKENKTNTGEGIVQFSSVFQSFWGFVKETQTQAFSSLLQAVKDACIQAKQIAVKVIGLNKKMTESYDYSSSYNNGFDFISSVKLV